MASSWPTVIVLLLVLALMACAWIFTPKGTNNTLVKTSIMLTLTCCYLMWMVAYLAQVNPLERPRKAFVAE